VIEMPKNGGEGVIVAEGGKSAGFALYVQDGKIAYHYIGSNERTNLVASEALPAGKSTVVMEFAFDGGGLGKGGEAVIAVDGKVVGRARTEHTVVGRFGIDTFGVRSDTGSPVADTYKLRFGSPARSSVSRSSSARAT
jgi:hypothetical protein